MRSSIFVAQVPWSLVQDLLDNICPPVSYNGIYYIDANVFRKLIYLKADVEFIDALRPFYRPSHLKYLNRAFSYNSFTTVLRQICKSHNHPYRIEMKFDKNEHQMVYSIPRKDLIA